MVWTLFAARLERVNGRPVLIADGKNIAKSVKKMSGGKSLHQRSESNTKPAFIMGHSAQAVSVLANAGRSVLAEPLAAQIHDGTVFTNRDKRTLLDKLLIMIEGLGLGGPVYLVADAYYGNGKIIKGMLRGGSHLVSLAKSNVVAYREPASMRGKHTRGRPRVYGKKAKLASLFGDAREFEPMSSLVYGEEDVTIHVRSLALLCKPAGRSCASRSSSIPRRKLRAFHVFLFAGVIAQGLMHYLAACHTETVWRAHRSWLRTIRNGVTNRCPTCLTSTIPPPDRRCRTCGSSCPASATTPRLGWATCWTATASSDASTPASWR